MTKGSSVEISKILSELNAEGGFLISILTDHHGFPIASAAQAGQDPESQSAVVAMIQKNTAHVHEHLEMGKVDLIQLSDEKGRNLIIRTFLVKKQELVLAVLTPDRRTAFRTLVRQTVKHISENWEV